MKIRKRNHRLRSGQLTIPEIKKFIAKEANGTLSQREQRVFEKWKEQTQQLKYG